MSENSEAYEKQISSVNKQISKVNSEFAHSVLSGQISKGDVLVTGAYAVGVPTAMISNTKLVAGNTFADLFKSDEAIVARYGNYDNTKSQNQARVLGLTNASDTRSATRKSLRETKSQLKTQQKAARMAEVSQLADTNEEDADLVGMTSDYLGLD